MSAEVPFHADATPPFYAIVEPPLPRFTVEPAFQFIDEETGKPELPLLRPFFIYRGDTYSGLDVERITDRLLDLLTRRPPTPPTIPFRYEDIL